MSVLFVFRVDEVKTQVSEIWVVIMEFEVTAIYWLGAFELLMDC